MAMVGRYRMEALWRVLGVLYLIFITLLLPVLVVLFILWMFVDILWQLLTNTAGPESRPRVFGGMNDPIVRLWNHIQTNVEWVVFGEGSWQWLP